MQKRLAILILLSFSSGSNVGLFVFRSSSASSLASTSFSQQPT